MGSGPKGLCHLPAIRRMGSTVPSSLSKEQRIIIAVVIVVAIVVVSGMILIFLTLGNMLSGQSPDARFVQWFTAATLDEPVRTTDLTVASVIGGTVYNQTVLWYSNYLTTYRGQGSDARGIHVASGNEVSPTMNSSMEDAVAVLGGDYGIVVEDHCYMHVEVVRGFGYDYTTLYIGLLKVNGSWFIGYATDVLDLGNLGTQ